MATSFRLEARTEASAKNGGFFGCTSGQKELFSKCKVAGGGDIPLVAVAHFIKTCIIHTPKKLSKACAVFYKWSDPYERIRGGSGGASDLRRTYLIFTARRRWVSRVPFPPTSPLLALPAKEILCSVTNGRGVLGRRQCGGGPLHLPPLPPFSPTIRSAAAASSPITIIVF